MHLKTDKVDFNKKDTEENLFLRIFSIHSSSRHENVVKCYKDFFGYFNALKTHCDQAISLEDH